MQHPTPNDDAVRVELIKQLFGADRGKKPDDAALAAYLLALRKMDTPRLARVVERVLDGEQYGDTDPYRVPQPGTLWRIAKELRLGALPNRPPLELAANKPVERPLDGWTINANQLLMAYITDPTTRRAQRLGVDSYVGQNGPPVHPGKLTVLFTTILVKWKDLWALDMREDREARGNLDGRKLWADYMASAEREIAEHERGLG